MTNIHYLYPARRSRNDTDTLGGRIWRARDAVDLSIDEIAERLGVGAPAVSAWESDRSEPPANRLFLLASVLGVSPAWLITGAGDEPDSETIESTLESLQQQLEHVRSMHLQTGRQIAALEREIERTISRLR